VWAALLDRGLGTAFVLVLSVALALEYEAVCRDPAQRIVSGLSEGEVETLVTALCAVAEPVVEDGRGRDQQADGTGINQFVATAVAEVSALRTAAFFDDRAARADVDAARRLLRRQGGQPPESEDQLEQE